MSYVGKLVLHTKLKVFFGKQHGDAKDKDKTVRFQSFVKDRSFFAKIKKTVGLTEPVYSTFGSATWMFTTPSAPCTIFGSRYKATL